MARQKAKQTNTLLVRTIVGKAKKSVYDLPDEAHVYGKRHQGTNETTRNPVFRKEQWRRLASENRGKGGSPWPGLHLHEQERGS
jgi:predicted RNase H-like nuclease